jgi:spermidine/putrescine transport system ATP-binding protein
LATRLPSQLHFDPDCVFPSDGERACAGLTPRGGLELSLPRSAWPEGAEQALIAVRPEKVHVSRQRSAAIFAAGEANLFEACIEEEVFKGATDHLVLVSPTGTRLSAVVANESAFGEIFHSGDRVFCGLHADDLVVVRGT